MRRALLLAALLLPFSRPAAAQARGGRAFSLFLDCTDFYCEPDFYRNEITFVDHVRERTAADVHVLVTRETTGGGGATYTLAFYGQHRFAGVSDTLVAQTPQGATEDERRQVIARTVKLGLARYLARTPEAARGSLAVTAPAASEPSAGPRKDPWNAWVFTVNSYFNGSRERDFSNNYLYGSLNANRVTEQWKSSVSINENYNDQTFTIDADTITSVTRDFGGNVLQVKSLGEHWSAGLRAGASSSTYLNQHLAASVSPALEYDVYPYKESTRRQLRFQYAAGLRRFRYNDTTVYFKIAETRPFESLLVSFEQKEKWGSVALQSDSYHFLDDLSKSRINFYLNSSVRVVKGLNVNLSGSYSVLHDQIYLPKGSLSREDVLLRQSQLATTYRAFFYGGISYSFGSVFNNVVNPRFGGGNDF